MECSQKADFSGRWNLMALWCSDTRDLRSRLVCPMCMKLQSLQGTWYTKQDFFSATKRFFREGRNLPMIRKGFKATFTPTPFKTRLILSDTPLMKGKVVKDFAGGCEIGIGLLASILW